jgi:hypothetical protein
MWILLLGGCFYDFYPSAFDWRIDRTIVAAISVWPIEADWRVPRTIDALILSPHRVEVVRTELCGLSDDQPVEIYGATCFSQRDLTEPIPGDLPLVWTPDALAFECTGPVIGGYEYGSTYDNSTGDTGPPAPTCGSRFPVRVHARSAEDEASAVTDVVMFTEPWDPRRPSDPDPATAHPRVEVIEGTVGAGNEVLLRFSVESTWGSGNYAWYADDGVYIGTGRTGSAGTTDNDRSFAQNRLEIPDDYHGPLRVAVVVQSSPPLWALTTLDVP